MCPTASRALQPHVPYSLVPYSLTCPTASRALQPHVPYSFMCPTALLPHVPYSLVCPTASCALQPCALQPYCLTYPTASCALQPYSLTCPTASRALQPRVPYNLMCPTTSCALQPHVPYSLIEEINTFTRKTRAWFVYKTYLHVVITNQIAWWESSRMASLQFECCDMLSCDKLYEPPSQLAPVSSEGFQSLCFNGCMGHLKRIGLGTRQCTGRDFASWLVNTTDHIHNLPPVTSKVHKFAQVRVSENSLWAYL